MLFPDDAEGPAYQKKTYDKVAAKWKTPAASEIPAVGKKTVVQAVIAKDGALATTEVSMSSGKKGWDAAALKAVKAAAPFDPLPAGFNYPSVQVHFHVGRRAVDALQTTPNSFPTATKASTASCRSSSEWTAEIWHLRRAWPCGTTGKPNPET